MPQSNETFNNLIDVCLQFEEDKALAGKADEMFKKLLLEYFFKKESRAGKNLEALIAETPVPDFIKTQKSLLDIDAEQLDSYVNGESPNSSLSGRILLSQPYLKAFQSNHPPSFGKLPESVQLELFEEIKNKNESIVSAFRKIMDDRRADKKRTVLALVALILKNVYRKNGRPVANLNESVEQIIRKNYPDVDSVFIADRKQTAVLKDDSRAKSIIKAFFMIKQFKEIAEITEIYKAEVERYIRRAKGAGPR